MKNTFCLHICEHLRKRGERGRSVPPRDLGELRICITFGSNERAGNDFVSEAAPRWTEGARFVHFAFRLNSNRSVLFHLVCFLQAESLIWQVVFLLWAKLLSTTVISFGLDEYAATIRHKGRKSQTAPSHEPQEADLSSQVKLEMRFMCNPANPCVNLD